MKLIIDDDLLKNLLEKKRSHIGSSWLQAIVNIGSGVAFLLTVWGTDLSKISGVIHCQADILFDVFGIVLILIGGYQLIMSVGSNHYNHKKLYQDILKLNKEQNRYSLVAIKNTFEEYSNKYLLYYDESWGVDFFPAFKTVSNDIESLKDRLSENLKVKRDKIEIVFLVEKTNQKKYSEEHKLGNL